MERPSKILKNFPIEFEGNVYWRSRSIAVVGFIFCKNSEGNWCVLLEQRGPDCPNEVGKWCVCCGYLDFNEDGKQAISRETHEECGINIPPEKFWFNTITFSTEGEQNVNLLYVCILRTTTDSYPLSNQFNEGAETSDLRWVPITEISSYDCAFGHKEKILELVNKFKMYSVWNN